MALHRRERCNPIGDYASSDDYRGAARVVAGGGARPTGGLLPVVLAGCSSRRVGSARDPMRVGVHAARVRRDVPAIFMLPRSAFLVSRDRHRASSSGSQDRARARDVPLIGGIFQREVSSRFESLYRGSDEGRATA
jgi:hypothetical protein